MGVEAGTAAFVFLPMFLLFSVCSVRSILWCWWRQGVGDNGWDGGGGGGGGVHSEAQELE